MSTESATPPAPSVAALLPGARRRAAARTGGPEDEGSSWLEHVLGWTLVVVVAMFVTQVGWF
ncbi:SCO1431 family membrane protein [Streptomyces sp. BI20]|uniref:SCO1431 family membrane protein n=1 Tax=Streptomyces sp. BI20 TaxID=3403460 RepID=UPI003C761FBC